MAPPGVQRRNRPRPPAPDTTATTGVGVSVGAGADVGVGVDVGVSVGAGLGVGVGGRTIRHGQAHQQAHRYRQQQTELFPVTYGDQDVVPGPGLWLRHQIPIPWPGRWQYQSRQSSA